MNTEFQSIFDIPQTITRAGSNPVWDRGENGSTDPIFFSGSM